MNKSKRIRELFSGDKLVRVVGAHNGLTARLVERNGFDAVWASSLEISASYAVPDADILSMKQYLEKAREINDAISIPVISDCGTGFGNFDDAMDMVKRYESSGIAAVCIKDRKFHNINSLLAAGEHQLAPAAEFAGKIKAAKSTQALKEFMVIARVEALIAGCGEKEALLRAEKYVKAGADAILIHSKLKTYNEIIGFAKKWDRSAPLVIIPTTFPSIMADFSEEELLDSGIKMIIFANHGLRASIRAIDETFREIKKQGGTHTVDRKIATIEDVFNLQSRVNTGEQKRKNNG